MVLPCSSQAVRLPLWVARLTSARAPVAVVVLVIMVPISFPVTPDGVGCTDAWQVSWLADTAPRIILGPRLPNLPGLAASGLVGRLTAYSRGGGCGFGSPGWVGPVRIPY